MEKAETQLTTQPVGRMHNCVIILLLWICIVRTLWLYTAIYAQSLCVCLAFLAHIPVILMMVNYSSSSSPSTGDSLDKYLCVFVWRNLHFAKSFSFLSSSLISFSQIHSIEDKSNAMQERQDFNEWYCINVKNLSFPFFCYLGDKAEDQQRQPIDNTMAI